MQFDEYSDQTVFITGAASGIGQAQAIAFIESGANVIGYDIDKDDLNKLIVNNPHHIYYVEESFSDTKSNNKAIKETIRQYKKIDILLNTTGVLDDFKNTLDTDEALWDKVMNTNIKGTYLVTNCVLPYMLEQNHGIIINMASIAGFIGGGGGAAYTASKHAIIGYTKQLD